MGLSERMAFPTKLLDRAGAIGVFQITFTDLDLASFPVPDGSILPLSAQLGLADTNPGEKAALALYDRAFARQLRP